MCASGGYDPVLWFHIAMYSWMLVKIAPASFWHALRSFLFIPKINNEIHSMSRDHLKKNPRLCSPTILPRRLPLHHFLKGLCSFERESLPLAEAASDSGLWECRAPRRLLLKFLELFCSLSSCLLPMSGRMSVIWLAQHCTWSKGWYWQELVISLEVVWREEIAFWDCNLLFTSLSHFLSCLKFS